MLGSAKTQGVGDVSIPLNYRVQVTPGSISVFSFSGAASSPTCYSTVLDGVGPFTYQWTITGSNISINSATSANTKFSASGTNDSYSETATITVTDTGNGNALALKNISVSFEFEL